MKLKAVLFDSSVLIDIPKSELRLATREFIEYFLPPEPFLSRYESLFARLQLGGLTQGGFFKELFSDLPARSRVKVRAVHDSRRAELVRLMPGVNSVLSALSNQFTLGLVSEVPKCWFTSDAERLGLNTNLFKTMVFSSEEQVLKTDGLFKKALIKLGVPAERVVYVTNHEREVKPAQDTGMTVVTIGDLEGDLSIESLQELTDLLTQDFNPKNVPEVNKP